MPGEHEAEAKNKEQVSLNARHNGATDDGAKEKQVESTTTAGKNPNKTEAPRKPQQQAKPKAAPPSEPSVFGNTPSEFFQFLKETWQEFRKVSWPNREQVIKETWSVIVLVALITGSVLAFDFAIAKTVFEPLDKYAKKVGGGVGHTTGTWGPLAPQPGIPVNNPSMPGNALPAQPAPAPSPGSSAPAQPAKP